MSRNHRRPRSRQDHRVTKVRRMPCRRWVVIVIARTYGAAT